MKIQIQTASEVKNSSHTRTFAHETRKNKQMITVFAIVMIVVTCLLAGCQKEIEEDENVPNRRKKIDDSYMPIRLKNGNEHAGKTTLVETKQIPVGSKNILIVLPKNTNTIIEFVSSGNHTSNAIASFSPLLGGGIESLYSKGTNSKDAWEIDTNGLTTSSSIMIDHFSGGSATINIYRLN